MGYRWQKLSTKYPRATSPWTMMAIIGVIGTSASVAYYHWQNTRQQRQPMQQHSSTYVPLDMTIETADEALEEVEVHRQHRQEEEGVEVDKAAVMYHLSSAAACKSKASTIISAIGPNDIEHRVSEDEIDQCDCGEDSFFLVTSNNLSAIGVADGVGGWTNVGVNPKEFSNRLMKNCLNEFNAFDAMHNVTADQSDDFGMAKNLAAAALPPSALDALSAAYQRIHVERQVVAGSSTACIVVLDGQKKALNFANLGDSAFMMIRDGKIVIRSKEQQHSFNAPFQLGIIPRRMKTSGSLDNKPSDADTAKDARIAIKEGDIIIMGTDGLFDNVYDREILSMLSSSNNNLQHIARQLVEYASACMSNNRDGPFAHNARTNGYYYTGSKPDDVTVIVARVDSHQHDARVNRIHSQNKIKSAP